MALTPSLRRDAWVARPGTRSRNVSAPAFAVTRSSPVGSGTTQASARQPRRSVAYVPRPPSSSPGTQASSRSPRSGTPTRRTARTAASAATRPAFMSHAPRPNSVSATTCPEKASRADHAAGLPIGTTSTWPLNINVSPPPEPAAGRPDPRPRRAPPRRRGSPAPRAARRSGAPVVDLQAAPRSSAASLAWISCSGSVPPTLGMRTSSASRAKLRAAGVDLSQHAGAQSVTAGSVARREGRPRRGPPPRVECRWRPQALPRMRFSLVPQTGQMP